MNGGWVIILWMILGIVFLVEHSPIWSYLRTLSRKSPVSLLALLALISASAIHATLKPEPMESGLEVLMGGSLCAEGGTNAVSSVTADQRLAGSMLHCVTTNTALSITPPPDSSYEPWTWYGVHDDIAQVPFEDGFLFPFGGTTYGRTFISSSGTLSFGRAKGNPRACEIPDRSNRAFMAPLQGSFGLVPRLGGSVSHWHTTNNTYIVAWSGLLQDRTNAPLSFSTELYPNGDFTYRYALSTNAYTATNMVVGAQANGGGEAYAFAAPAKIVDGLTLHWIGFTPISTNTTSTSDTDDDGITDEDEILVYRTDPTVADTDGDGISDGDEIAESLDPLSPDTNGDGAPDGVSLSEWLADPLFANETNAANVVLSLEGAVPIHCTAVLQISDLLIPLSGTNSWNLHLEDAVRYAYSLKTTGNPTVKLAASPNAQPAAAGFVLYDPFGLFSDSGAYGGDGWMVFPRLELKPIPETECECLHGTDYRNYSIALDPLDWSEYSTNLVWTTENGTACITNESIATLTLHQGFESASGTLSLPFPLTRWGSIEASVSIHRCQAYSGTYCFACGLYHTGEGGCGHDAGCAAVLALENECTCAPRFVRVNSDDDNFSGTEDRTESGLPEGEDDLLSFTPLDFTRTCCCNEGAQSHVKLTAVSSGLRLWKDGETIGVGEEIPGGSGFAIEATEQSPTLGGFAVSYDIYDVETNLVRSLTRRFTAANVQIKPDYDDDGAFTADDAWLKTQERPGEEWLVARREAPYKIKLQNGCPSDAVLEVCMTGSTNRPALKMSSEDPAVMTPFTGVATNAPLAVKNSGIIVWLDASGTNAAVSLEYRIAPPGGGHLVSDSQPIRVVDTSLGERWIAHGETTTYDFSFCTEAIYWEVWSDASSACVGYDNGGTIVVGENLSSGDYYVVAFFNDIFPPVESISYDLLHIVEVDIEAEVTNLSATAESAVISIGGSTAPIPVPGGVTWEVEDNASSPPLSGGLMALSLSESSGLSVTSSSDSGLTVCPRESTPGSYTIRARSTKTPEAYDECTVNIVNLDVSPTNAFSHAGSVERTQFAVVDSLWTNITWTISPILSNGARLYDHLSGGVGDTSLDGRHAWVSAGNVAQTYTLTATANGIENLSTNVFLHVLDPDIDVDTNNDGIIDSDNEGEDGYEQYAPGLLLDRYDAQAESSGQLKPIKLRGFVSGLGLGAKLEKSGGTAGLRLYAINSTNAPSLPYPLVWDDADPPPQFLYAQGRAEGETDLRFSVTNPLGDIIASNMVHLTVLEPASYAPGGGSVAAIWAPLIAPTNCLTDENRIGRGSLDQLVLEIQTQGWATNNILWCADTTGDGDTDFGTCTPANLLAMRNAGIVAVNTHGMPGYVAAVFAPPTSEGKAAIQNWCTEITGATCEPQVVNNATNCYYARIPSSWFESNWKQHLDARRAIVNWVACYSDVAEGTMKSLMDAGGGRWRIGYSAPTWSSLNTVTLMAFLGNMKGTENGGTKRTAGEAYGNGVGYGQIVRMSGNPWTTLCPAPMTTNQLPYPSSVSENRKGWGSVVFDTYCDNSASASSIVSGTGISGQRWIQLGAGFRAIGLDFDKTNGSAINVTIDSQNCVNLGVGGGRNLDPDSVAPNGGTRSESL